MKTTCFLILMASMPMLSQTTWHVKPYGSNRDYPTTSNSGKTIETAWTLQEALTNQHGTIRPGDVIYLHGGIYQGHFKCTLQGLNWGKNQFITVKNFPGETVTINGNIHDGKYVIPNGMDDKTIFMVTGKYIQFENFRITCLGDFTRMTDNAGCNPKDVSFHGYTGVRHDPEFLAPCRFVNMIVDNIPGVGFASWKETADTEIYGCIMYYNGYMKSNRKKCSDQWDTHDADNAPSNVIAMENCIYTQNAGSTGKTRRISNNIFLNNYKSGIAIWSAEKNPGYDYLSNYYVDENIFVNNASPVRGETPNMLIYSDTRNANNFVKNVAVIKNIFYFNTSNDISGISTKKNRNLRIENNEFYHGTAAVELAATNQNVTFKNNLYVGKRIKVFASPSEFKGNGRSRDKWKMDGNRYYTTNPTNLVLTPGSAGISLADFQKKYKTEKKSKVIGGIPPLKKTILQNAYNPCRFHVTYYNKAAKPGTIDFDFSKYKIANGTPYTIRDAEDYHNPIAEGKYDASTGKVSFPIIAAPGFEMPRPAESSGKTSFVTRPVHSNLNFRVYVIDFECGY
jgi:hypothetical protein